MANMLKTRFEWGLDAPMRCAAAVEGARLLTVIAAGNSVAGGSKVKPRVRHTAAATEIAVGAAKMSTAAEEDVTVVARGWQWLDSAEAIVAGVDVYPAAAGRVQQFTGTEAVPAGARPYGMALSSSAGLDDPVLVRVYI